MPNGEEYFLIPFYFPGVSESILEEVRAPRLMRQEPPSDFPYAEIKTAYLTFIKPLLKILNYAALHAEEGFLIAWEKGMEEANIRELPFEVGNFYNLLFSLLVSVAKSVRWMFKLPVHIEMHSFERWEQMDVLFDIVRAIIDNYDKWKGPVAELIMDDVIKNWE